MPNDPIPWLLDSDPAIRWQVMRDLLGAPEGEWRAERARVETEGWGARLLSLQDDDGQWAGGAYFPRSFDWATWEREGQPWTSTTWALTQLREFGISPASQQVHRSLVQVGAHSRWSHPGIPLYLHNGQAFWNGVAQGCLNGRLVADGAYFGVTISPVVERLLRERGPDGGWNCEMSMGISDRSSFHCTINVLEGLLEFERATGGTRDSREARRNGEEFLLVRDLFRRLSTGRPADERFLSFTYPSRWAYDILRGLDYFRDAATLIPSGNEAAPDPRLGEAIEHVRSRQSEDGTWPLDYALPGRTWFDMDEGVGKPSRWVTLRAMRVLKWWEQGQA